MAALKKIAHRGASGEYPENTQLAFVRAIEARADMIELDCQMTRDGHVVVFHDESLMRTAGVRGTVKGKTLEQLKVLGVGACVVTPVKRGELLTALLRTQAMGGMPVPN